MFELFCLLLLLLLGLFLWRVYSRQRTFKRQIINLLGLATPNDQKIFQTLAEREQKLHDCEKRLKIFTAMFEALKEGVILTNHEGEILYFNPRAMEILGVTRYRQGLNLQELLREEALWRAFARKEATVLEVESFWPLPRTLEITLIPLSEGFVGLILQDITPFRRLSDLRRDFVSYLAHEIRTPLTAIEGYAESLLEEVSEPWTEELQVILRNAQRLSRLVKDLQVLSRLEIHGISEGDLEEIDLREVVHAALDVVRPKAEEKDLDLQILLSQEAALIKGSFDDLVRAVVNLLDNAIKFSPPGATIDLQLRQKGNYWELVLRDQGPGIPSLEQERVFERFYRGRRGDKEGSGLGLAIVKHIVLAHGGQIRLESKPGQGTTFFLSLPALQEEPRAP